MSTVSANFEASVDRGHPNQKSRSSQVDDFVGFKYQPFGLDRRLDLARLSFDVFPLLVLQCPQSCLDRDVGGVGKTGQRYVP
jgi:hypothetical protein